MMDTSNLKHRLDDKLQSRQAESMEEKIMTMPTVQTALTEVRSNYIALTSDALSIIKENLKNQPLSHALFDMVKSPLVGQQHLRFRDYQGMKFKRN